MIDIEQGGFILLDKPYGWTTFQAVKKVQYILKNHFHTKRIKIGHAGTLDPLATGLLILCVGKYTKQIEMFQAREKEYTGTFFLGATTSSFDREKPVDCVYDTKHISSQNILDTAQSFIGEQEQIPPVFSAVKIGGKRAYDFAREQKDVAIKPRTITISSFEITDIEMPRVGFRIVCSKGTYIRSLARDFGLALGSGAYLDSLCRTRIGEYSLEDARQLEDIAEEYSFNLRK